MGSQTGSNPALANIMSGLASPSGGAGLGGLGGMVAGMQQQQHPNMPFTEHNVPSRPGYQMINPLGALMNPLQDNAGPKHVSLISFVSAVIYHNGSFSLRSFHTMRTF